jgi:hypothetical protein
VNNSVWIRTLFILAALYDGVLGVVFLVIPWYPFATFDVAPPNHWGYVQFPAALLIVFAIMFLRIAQNPSVNRLLIPYGILLKVAYCGVAFFYWATSGIPWMWQPFAILDVVWVVLFAWAYSVVGERTG